MEVYDLYFATLIAWRWHPGYLREGAIRPTLKELADEVDKILEMRQQWQSL